MVSIAEGRHGSKQYYKCIGHVLRAFHLRHTPNTLILLSVAGALLDDAWIELRADNDQDGCDHKEDAEIG
jgi:hypothetical protein